MMTFLATENPARDDETRKIVMHVNFADGERLNYVLNNVENIRDYYRERSNEVEIRVVCHGPGLHMLRVDTSPVKDRLSNMADSIDELSFYACANTMERMAKTDGERPEIVGQATLVQAGLPEIIELQRLGWIYVKP
jgi:intracellular sulfur oxidation DsrE/DsrF family protein